MRYNPEKHHRRSIRLQGYDYSREGMYFITICVKDRLHEFGQVEQGEMKLNDLGNLAHSYIEEIPLHYNKVTLGEYVVMPNHVHLILVIHDHENEFVGTCHGMSNHGVSNHSMSNDGISNKPTWESGKNDFDNDCNLGGGEDDFGDGAGTCHGVSLHHHQNHDRDGMIPQPNINQFGKSIPGSVSVIINQYKSSVKRWCNKNDHSGFKWQPRFYDHIIRNEIAFRIISAYIRNNPKKWDNDSINPKK